MWSTAAVPHRRTSEASTGVPAYWQSTKSGSMIQTFISKPTVEVNSSTRTSQSVPSSGEKSQIKGEDLFGRH